MKKTKKLQKNIAVFQTRKGAIELRSDIIKETVWASQADIVKLFEKDQSVISRHIASIFKDGEVDEKSNMQKMHIANSDKPTVYYSLDVILAIGYRANSSKAIEFRKWATKVLKQHITQGYTINPAMIQNNYAQFMEAVANIKKLLPKDTTVDTEAVLELLSVFADTWLSLDAYDKDSMVTSGATRRNVALTAIQLQKALAVLKIELMKRGEASELFGREKDNTGILGIVGNVMQTFGGKPLYPTVEEKAAHLFYFVVKNHPFTDGNKRSGAFAFVWFLKKAGILDSSKLTPSALTALTLFIAESDPKNKERMVRLILQLLKK